MSITTDNPKVIAAIENATLQIKADAPLPVKESTPLNPHKHEFRFYGTTKSATSEIEIKEKCTICGKMRYHFFSPWHDATVKGTPTIGTVRH